ncbi:amino acid ABC transporter substrate-binding protein [Pseudomonas sp. HMWF032]|uniref:substrate-binding periplasmic protein n=1 Tax=unclassified Pseudomonas TaxID=196821 RepID=UPI000D3667C8|nr:MULTISPECIES: ABC transporter substrate-binding protein [unclassified Pseudomonas]PTS82093.1 amino acid ABC transporter substrate-binding protein [Pseudomonas sp. HMWF032]PTT80680.1 amino acid ABC transporter substrate-binding protein [Pseudomonas sp. HMWF010]WAC45829.1 ABC transporter substrate-binding protein [Pseudomonas sp. SL4(2022)]
MSAIRLFTALLLLSAVSLVRAEPLVLLTENLPPFSMAAGGGNFAKDADVQGISSDTVRGLCSKAQLECQVILRFPWERQYKQALESKGYGVFSTARTADRESLFKWVGPIVVSNWVLLAKADSTIALNSLEQAGDYRIGGYRDDAISQFLIDRGVTVQTSLQDKENLSKLEKGLIDLWATNEAGGRYQAKQSSLGVLKVVHRFNSAELYLALNKETPDEVVQKLQKALDDMRAQGELDTIKDAYR